ncbi:bifunctional metallophosphatase/5'-nucleotidase [bacterium]|nr:bifunctional metallophosphatase/5'-nucleotidase [bacterium]
MKFFSPVFLVFITALFVSGCMNGSYGEANTSSDIPRKLVIMHTTDTHSKYFPFWMEPNMFDRDMGLSSSYAPCWDLDYSGGGSFCSGAYDADKKLFKVWNGSVYAYMTEGEMEAAGVESEDLDRNGVCDFQDCQRCWDVNRNNVCDPDEDVDGVYGCSTADCDMRLNVEKVRYCWSRVGGFKEDAPVETHECEKRFDITKDNLCGFNDCIMMWDRNHNFVCDYPWNGLEQTWNDADGNPILDEIGRNEARSKSEDVNKDGYCNLNDYKPGLVDSGGVARVATVMNDIRARHQNSSVLYFDTGDTFQGAPQFNLFRGQVEMEALRKLGVTAMVIGNHEFDNGTKGLVDAYTQFGGFPLLAANYFFNAENNRGLQNQTRPYLILTRAGMKIGVIGIANDSSLNSIYKVGGSLGFNAVDPIDTAKKYVKMLRNQVDVVVLLSHQGLDGDYELAEEVPGVDLILGGHHHVVLDPAKVVKGPDGRDVLIIHSGVNFKVVGELEIIVHNGKITWHHYQTHPIDNKIEENGEMTNLLQRYWEGLQYAQDLQAHIARASATLLRNDPAGGDSVLGNMITDAMTIHEMSKSQCAVTNSMGIRADIPAGFITREKLYEVFPFENTLVTMYMSGREFKDMFDFIARRSASRGCKTQVQVSGIHVEMDCSPAQDLVDKYGSYALTKELRIGKSVIIENYKLVQPYVIFKMATNDYIADGGSGFYMLDLNTTKLDTSVSLRDAVAEFMSAVGVIDPATYNTGEKRIIMRN